MDFITGLTLEFSSNKNAKVALGQKAYMKNLFEFYGIKTPLRRELQKPFLNKQYLPDKSELEPLIRILWQKPEREYQYFTQELFFKYNKKLEESDIALFEYMIVHKSWWDTVDFIATKLLASYFKSYPNKKTYYIKKWIKSNNVWLQRSALLFQLKYKATLDTDLLDFTINSLLDTKEFFINKAIGWILREYSKSNPQWVINFVEKTKLSALSKREGLRLIKS